MYNPDELLQHLVDLEVAFSAMVEIHNRLRDVMSDLESEIKALREFLINEKARF